MIGFIIAKALGFLPFGGIIGKIMLFGGILLVAFIGFKFWLSAHDDAVIARGLLAWETAQYEQLELDRAEFARRLSEVRSEEADRVRALIAERDAWARRTSILIERIKAGEFNGSDDPSSEVLQEAIRILGERIPPAEMEAP